ncbi:hypothetical protein IWY39_002569 [Sphingobium sp. JAI105]|uniref:hypothetical protein n=1 Tax=Sphingobium sp. JAI105 TaxID=2787715 RepID=UPI0018CB7991|nr:hypothetical protein [Sphingobium sp. JAI105]MBG6116207.1 hypothetical protein [Sphingobium sp. JAI105]MBG6118765.1 hypothetical protein [Sphingobium sp. JAI105]
MSDLSAILIMLASAMCAALAYARARHFHSRVLRIDPLCAWKRRNPFRHHCRQRGSKDR